MVQPQNSSPVLSKISTDNPEDVFVKSVESIIKKKLIMDMNWKDLKGLNNNPKPTSLTNTNTSCIWFRRSKGQDTFEKNY